MTRLTNVKRIIVEDFEPQYQQLISKLGFVLNEFMTDTVDIVNGNIDFDNLNQNLLQIDITVNSSGTPIRGADVKISKTSPSGLVVIRAQNLTNSSIYPTAQPFISWKPKSKDILTISNIVGLQADNSYRLTIIIY